MANDAQETVVASNGQVFIGALDAVAPSDVTADLDAAWTELGYVSEDGATFAVGQDITDINAWQSFYPIRRIITGRTVTVSFNLRQWNSATIEFALGGVVEDNGTEFVYTPPEPQEIRENSLVLQWQDGEKNYRLFLPRGMVSENVDVNLTRSGAADLPVTFAVTDPGTDELGDPVPAYTLFTDDPAFAPAAS